MDEHYIWLFNKSDNRGLWQAFFVSLLLHCVMIAVMATTSVFYPLAGDSGRLDVVWLYPSLRPGGETGTPPPPQEMQPPVASKNAGEAAPVKTVSARPEPARKTAETRKMEPVPPPPEPSAVEEEVKPATSPPEPLLPEPEPEPEMRIPAQAPFPQTAEIKPESGEKIEPAEKEAEERTEPTRKEETGETAAVRAPTAPETKQPATAVVETPSREAPVRDQKPPATIPPEAAKDAAPPPEVARALPNGELTPSPALPSQTSPLPGIPGEERKAVTEKRSEPALNGKPRADEKPAEKSSEQPVGPKGIFAAPLSGDLKIEITGPEEALRGVKISVIFREYPKTSHNRPMTKASARNFRTATPKMVRTANNTLQAVIEIAGEGVYDFRNISDTGSSDQVAFTVRIYENSIRAKTKPMGARRVGAKGSIAKVLMPEGILWNDESAFSGYMEDSESITRFDSETGLIWKEYKE